MGVTMDLRRVCLDTAALYLKLAALGGQHQAMYLTEAEKWSARADTELRLKITFEPKSRIQGGDHLKRGEAELAAK